MAASLSVQNTRARSLPGAKKTGARGKQQMQNVSSDQGTGSEFIRPEAEFFRGLRDILEARSRDSARPGGARESSAAVPLKKDASTDTSLAKPSDSGPWWVISPRSHRKIKWDLFCGLLIIFSVMVVPFRIGFEFGATGVAFYVDCCIDICFGIDMILCFCTGFFNESEVYITDPKAIAFRYVTGFFLIDLCSTVPFDLIVSATSGGGGSNVRSLKLIRVVRLVRLMKLMRLFKLQAISRILEEQLSVSQPVTRMIKLIFKILFLAHLLSCFFYFFATPVCEAPEDDPDGPNPKEPCPVPYDENNQHHLDNVSWARYFGVDRLDLASRYIASFHFITATIMAVGYGDIFPMSWKERLYSIITQLIGAVCFGFILSAITSLLDATNVRDTEQKKRMAEIKEWLSGRELSAYLTKRIWSHFTYTTNQKSIFRDELDTLQGLPTHLRNRVVELSYSKWIQHVEPCFLQEDRSMLTDVVMQLKPSLLALGEIILDEHEISSEIFFISAGQIDAVMWDGDPNEDHAVVPTRASAAYPSGRISMSPSARARGSLNSNSIEETLEAFLFAGILCAIYSPGQLFGDIVVNPLRHQGGASRTELLALCKEDLRNILWEYPLSAERYDARTRHHQQCIDEVIGSAEFSGHSEVKQLRKTKGKMLIKGQLTAVSSIAPESFASLINFENVGQVTIGPALLHTHRWNSTTESVEEADETETDIVQRRIIPPFHANKVKWDFCIGALILYSVIVIPFRIGFGVEPNPVEAGVDIVIDIFFLFDMIASFRTAFVDSEGILVTVPFSIRRNYLRGWFFIDFFSTCPIDRIFGLALSNTGDVRAVKLIRIVRLARLLKLVRLLKMSKIMQLLESMAEASPITIKLFKLSGQMLFMAHLLGCFWFLVSVEGNEGKDECESGKLGCVAGEPATTWWKVQGIEDHEVEKQYIAAVYWVFTTMTTVGYGDITPQSNSERLYAIFTMVFGATVFGYIVGSIADLAGQDTSVDALTTKRISVLKDYCDEQTVSKMTVDAVKKHYTFWYQECSPFNHETALLADLPNNIRKEAILYIHKEAVQRIGLFTVAQLPDWFIAGIIRKLEPQAFLAGDPIIRVEEAHIPQEIFFMVEGVAYAYSTNNYDPNDEETLAELFQDTYYPGDIFGIDPFLEPKRHNYCTVVCAKDTSCSAYVLRQMVLSDINISQPEMGLVLREALTDALVQQCLKRGAWEWGKPEASPDRRPSKENTGFSSEQVPPNGGIQQRPKDTAVSLSPASIQPKIQEEKNASIQPKIQEEKKHSENNPFVSDIGPAVLNNTGPSKEARIDGGPRAAAVSDPGLASLEEQIENGPTLILQNVTPENSEKEQIQVINVEDSEKEQDQSQRSHNSVVPDRSICVTSICYDCRPQSAPVAEAEFAPMAPPDQELFSQMNIVEEYDEMGSSMIPSSPPQPCQ